MRVNSAGKVTKKDDSIKMKQNQLIVSFALIFFCHVELMHQCFKANWSTKLEIILLIIFALTVPDGKKMT